MGKRPTEGSSQPSLASVREFLVLREWLQSLNSPLLAGGLATFISSLRQAEDAESAEFLDFIVALKAIGEQRPNHSQTPSQPQQSVSEDDQAANEAPVVTLANQIWNNWGVIDDVNTFATGQLFTRKMFRPVTAEDIGSAILQAERDQVTIRALGSGWSFSDAVLPQSTPATVAEFIIEMFDEVVGIPYAPLFDSYGYAIDTSALTASLQDLLPRIVADGGNVANLFFNEAGITIDRLNELLNRQSPPLAMPTLGGSGGQTIAGAISTGTHGSDFDRAPIADAVSAMYLVSAGGIHHWIESKSEQFTDPEKIRRCFPIRVENIHYDDKLLHAASVSMGAMGVIYAVILRVVPQYALIQFNLWDTWEDLLQNGGIDLSDVAHGSAFPEIAEVLDLLYPEGSAPPYSRALEVAVNPIKNDDGTHNCYATIRYELPVYAVYDAGLSLPAGIVPGNLGTVTLDNFATAILGSPDCGPLQAINFGWAKITGQFNGNTLVEQAQKLISWCKGAGYYWAVRAVMDMIFQKTFPTYIPDGVLPITPQIDLGYKVMSGNVYGPTVFGLLQGTSIEASFPFKDAINYVNSALALFDQGIPNNIYPAGYLSLRACGPTSALLGMQQFGELPSEEGVTDEFPNVTGSVEVSLLGNSDDFRVIVELEALARGQQGILHWGQSNGAMNDLDVRAHFDAVITWKAARQHLDPSGTFVNLFMQRCGLV